MPAQELIKTLQLKPHPEGGYYKETYRSKDTMQVHPDKNRNISTAIYYLLENKDKSHFHRIQSDELWFFHQGEPLEVVAIIDEKEVRIVLGNDIAAGHLPQAVIPAHTWFGSHVKDGKGYSLVSCTVAPGFDFADFEVAERKELIRRYPHLEKLIREFTFQ